jgi:geranylgeranyl diphosphate synthase type II
MLILAYRFIGDTQPSLLKKMLDVFTETALEICEGQQYDMDFERRHDVSEDEYLEMIRLKTAVLIACCLKSGALIGGASDEDADRLYQSGIYIGLAFQLQDDLLDTYGDPYTFGKNIGGDILCNKKTFLHIKMMQSASELQKEQIFNIQTDTNYRPDEKIATVKSIYESLGVRKLTTDRIQHYYNRAMQELTGLHLSADRLQTLIGTIELLLGRKS